MMSTDTTLPSNGNGELLVLFVVENKRILVGVEGSNNPGVVVEELTGHFRCFVIVALVVLVQQHVHVLLIIVARVVAFLGRRNTSNCADVRRAVTIKADMID